MDDYKPNSHRSREELPEKTKVKKVVTGVVKTKKKSPGKRFVDDFMADDINNVTSHILSDVLVPAIKDMFYDAITSGLGMLLGHDIRSSYRGSSNSREPYNKYYKQKTNYNSRTSEPSVNRSRVERYEYNDIVLDSRAEAEEVLDVLNDYLDDFGMVSVMELYAAIGKQTTYTDNKYGWFDLRSASVCHTRDGYLLKLPKIQLLD